MASSFDRLESVYRLWVQERSGGDPEVAAAGELRRELHTALGTAKWQLNELERAIRSNDAVILAGKYTRARHDDFVAAIAYCIVEVENSLKESNVAEGRGPLSWVHLDEDERDDLAAFLAASPQQRDKVVSIPSAGDIEVGSSTKRVKMDMSAESSKDSSGSTDLGLGRVKEDMRPGLLDTEELSVRVLILDHGVSRFLVNLGEWQNSHLMVHTECPCLR